VFVNQKKYGQIVYFFVFSDGIYLRLTIEHVIMEITIKNIRKLCCSDCMLTRIMMKNKNRRIDEGIVTYTDWFNQLLESTSSSHDSQCMRFFFLLLGIILKSGID
jgi:hypothetical protein